jgi:hypothetical protein
MSGGEPGRPSGGKNGRRQRLRGQEPGGSMQPQVGVKASGVKDLTPATMSPRHPTRLVTRGQVGTVCLTHDNPVGPRPASDRCRIRAQAVGMKSRWWPRRRQEAIETSRTGVKFTDQLLATFTALSAEGFHEGPREESGVRLSRTATPPCEAPGMPRGRSRCERGGEALHFSAQPRLCIGAQTAEQMDLKWARFLVLLA